MRQILVILFSFLAAACTGDRFVVKVDSYGTAPTKPKTYMLYSGLNGVGAGDLQFAEFARFTENALRARGYQRVNNPSDANYAIFLAYGIGEPRQTQETYSTPVMGQTGVLGGSTYGTINSFGNTATFSGYTSFIPTYGVTGYSQDTITRTEYDRFVNLEAYDSGDIARSGSNAPQVWKTNITSSGSSGDLRAVFPVMVAAAVDKIGSSSGGKITKRIFDTDQSVKMVKGEIASGTSGTNALSPSQSQYSHVQTQSNSAATSITNQLDSYRGWSIGKLDGVQGFTGCYAMNDNSVKLGLPMSIMIEKGRYDDAILSVRHDGKAVPKGTAGNITLGSLQLNNLPVATLTGDEAFAPLRLTSDVRNALQSRGLISWDVNENYAYVLPEAPELINRLFMCADAPNLQAYKSMLGSLPSTGAVSQPKIDFVGGQDGLTNEQRYKLARQIQQYQTENSSESKGTKLSGGKQQLSKSTQEDVSVNTSLMVVDINERDRFSTLVPTEWQIQMVQNMGQPVQCSAALRTFHGEVVSFDVPLNGPKNAIPSFTYYKSWKHEGNLFNTPVTLSIGRTDIARKVSMSDRSYINAGLKSNELNDLLTAAETGTSLEVIINGSHWFYFNRQSGVGRVMSECIEEGTR